MYMYYIGILYVLDTVYFYRTRIENGYEEAEKWSATIYDILYESEQYYLFNIISQNTRK